MIQASVKGFERFGEVTPEIEALCVAALNDAAEAAGAAATRAASIPLEIRVLRAEGDATGFSSGIRSEKRGHTGVRVAPFFDQGTLAERKKALKRARRGSWQVTRGSSSYTAHRHEIVPGEGIAPQRFFSKARAVGRRALLARIDRGI